MMMIDHDVDDHDGDDESIFEVDNDTDGGDDPDEDPDEDDHDDHQIVCTDGSFEEIWIPLGDDDDHGKDHCGDWL